MLRDQRKRRLGVSFAAALGLALVPLAPAASQTGTTDLLLLQQRCGAAEPQEGTYEIVREHALAGFLGTGKKPLAFEENRLFIYAMAGTNGRSRMFFLLKPSTFVVEDAVRAPAEGKAGPLKKSQFRGGKGGKEYRVEVISGSGRGETLFLNVFHLPGKSGEGAAPSNLVKEEQQLKLAVTADRRVFRLTLPLESSRAGTIEVAEPGGRILLPDRLLPSGIMPHGPEGTRLLERWDSPYRENRTPGWDVGRPSSSLVKALEDGALRRGRAIVLGCGTGTNAIYLARRGYEVTGVDVSPTALIRAEEKARKAGVSVRWMVADVLALPELKPFDLIFDRGCYHHVRRYNAAGYVETARRLSHPGTQLLILAGSDRQTGGGGPPRVKESEIRGDFSGQFEIQWLREVRFDRRDSGARGPLAWSVLLRRKGKSPPPGARNF